VAYNPGVTDRSGEIRAAGKMSLGAGIAQGAAEGYKAYQQNTLRNKALQGENNGLLSVFMNDPEARKYAPEGLEKFIDKSIKGGGLSLNDNVQLNGLLNTAIATKSAIQKQKGEAQDQQMKAQQMEQNRFIMAEQMRKQEIAKQNQDQLEKLRRIAALGRTNGVLTPEAQAETQRTLDNPWIKARLDADAAGIQLDDNTAAQFVIANQKKPGLNIEKYRENVLGPNGEIIRTDEVAIDAATGLPIGRGMIQQPPKVLHSEDELVNIANRTEEGKHRMKAAVEFNSSVASGAEAAQAALPNLQEIERLYANGVTSGFGQDFLTSAGAAALRMNIGDAKSQADKEQLQKLLTSTALGTAQGMKGEGTISNFEREMIAKASADVGKSPEANLRIIRLARAAHERQIDMEKMRQDLEDQGLDTPKIKAKLERWRMQNPLGEYVTKIKAEAEKPSPAAAPKLPEGWKFTP
jgi:hypothetical protein